MRTITTYVIPVVSLVLFAGALLHVHYRRETRKVLPPPVKPWSPPFSEVIAASGIVEPETENVDVSAPVAGIVRKMMVQVGDRVEAGQPLFCLDDSLLQAQLDTRRAELRLAETELARLNEFPRPEEVTIARASLNSAIARWRDAEDELTRLRELLDLKAVSHREVVHAERASDVAQAEADARGAEFELLLAGTWACDRAVGRAKVDHATANCRQAETAIEQLTVRSPISADVLQINVQLGEFVSVPPVQPPMVLGDTRNLHVRADIDECEISRFNPYAPAVAAPRGREVDSVSLTFIRLEPYVVPKRSLSGYQYQIVDTRVMQVLYQIDPGAPHLPLVGQQVDIYISAEKAPGDRRLDFAVGLPVGSRNTSD